MYFVLNLSISIRWLILPLCGLIPVNSLMKFCPLRILLTQLHTWFRLWRLSHPPIKSLLTLSLCNLLFFPSSCHLFSSFCFVSWQLLFTASLCFGFPPLQRICLLNFLFSSICLLLVGPEFRSPITTFDTRKFQGRSASVKMALRSITCGLKAVQTVTWASDSNLDQDWHP